MRMRSGITTAPMTLVILCGAMLMNSAGSSNAQSTPPPIWAVALRSYRWSGPRTESNKSFFRDFTLAKLATLDEDTKLLFVSNNVLVAYHTKEEGGNWRTERRWLEGFFLKTEDGSLLAQRQWPSLLRKDNQSANADSEARMAGIQNGRFLVISDGTLMLYSDNLNLIDELKLEPFGRLDVWGASRVPGGREIFLRHEILKPFVLTYHWIDADTFHPLSEMNGDIMWGRGTNALAEGVLGYSENGICIRRPSTPETLVCDDPFCRVAGTGIDTVISPDLVGLSRRNGIGVVKIGHGLLWSETVGPEDNFHGLSFGVMTPSLEGNRFAISVVAERRYLFNSIELKKGPNPTILVFNSLERQHIFAIRIRAEGSSPWSFALSPDGSKLATFDGAKIALYKVN